MRITDPTQVDAADQAAQQCTGRAADDRRPRRAVQPRPDQHYQIAFVPAGGQAAARDAVTRSIEIIRKRIDALGTKEPIITQQGADRIVVEAPGESDPEKLKAVIGKTAKLTFQMVDDGRLLRRTSAAGRIPPDDEVSAERRQVPAGLCGQAARGRHRRDADQRPAEPRREQRAGRGLHASTASGASASPGDDRQNIGKPLRHRPRQADHLGPEDQFRDHRRQRHITGNFTEEIAHDLALLLKSGALPAPLNVVEQRTVGAELGADAVRAGADLPRASARR